MHFPGTCIYRMCADHLDLQKCHGTGRKDAGGNKEYKRRNLDFELPVETDDELGQLCGDLEDMRKRLKNTAEEKLKLTKKIKN